MRSAVLRFLHRYLAYSTPLAIIVMCDGQAWPHVLPVGVIGDGAFITTIGILFLLWLLSLLTFLVHLTVDEAYRDRCFKHLVGIRERDEREEQIVGRAAKSSFLFMFALLLVLFFVSTWRYGEKPGAPGENRSFTIGHLDLLRSSDAPEPNETVFRSIPVSETSLLLGLIGLQIASFRFFRRKAEKET